MPDRLASAASVHTPTRLVPVASSPTRPSGASEVIPEEGVAHVYGYTYQRPGGNRLVVGWGALPLFGVTETETALVRISNAS